MSHPNKVLIRRVVIEPAPVELVSPFLGIGVRELARATGLDPGYLSRVKNGKIPVSIRRYKELIRVSDSLMGEQS